MVAFLYVTSLIIAAVSVSVLGATFSIFGLSKLFAGAATAVAAMASALEFSKFVVAAFLHRTWPNLNKVYRTYLLISVVVLSGITSMGIFGFLSDAYQTSSVDLSANQIKVQALETERAHNAEEITRLNQSIDLIPGRYVTRKLQAQKAAQPMIDQLNRRSDQITDELKQLQLQALNVKQKVGPLIYVARAFHKDIDTIVKDLILVFVSVFDPLAICLVIATSEALKLKSMGLLNTFAHQRDAGHAVSVPRPAFVPPEAPPGDVLRMRFVDDPEAEAEAARALSLAAENPKTRAG